ncbi:B3 domain-containing protein Os06g0112300-like [Chenopodium quinoa]|uniref:B3 domain-containing protein Os06g0112300-like n=1 Tax=Chenopodium quinoa TaxID=63459 RepID=UPI000B7867B8|nr:B3 domain-containing protein Os06g0112300-like [Chenopodium quinoa]
MSNRAMSEMKPRANTCEDIDIEPKTGAPFFHVNLTKTHVSPLYLLTIPAEGARLLPNIEAPVILTRGTESWTMNYIGNNIVHKRLDKRWKQFAVDNKLKVGDVCTFELTSKDPMRLKVQVLRGDFPAALLNSDEEEDEQGKEVKEEEEKEEGETSYNPIVVE